MLPLLVSVYMGMKCIQFFLKKQGSFSEAQIGLELTVLQVGSSVGWRFSPISRESWIIGVTPWPALLSVLVVSNSLRLLL